MLSGPSSAESTFFAPCDHFNSGRDVLGNETRGRVTQLSKLGWGRNDALAA